MKCPYCGHGRIETIDTRHTSSKVRRRRICTKCEERFTTYEQIYFDGKPFDGDIAKVKPLRTRSKKIKPRLRFQILQRDNYTCQCCGRKAPDVILHVDHKISATNGGKTEPSNLWVLCEDCNFGKWTKNV